jgi:hypothetical protein
MRDPNTSDAGELRRLIVQHFSDDALRSLCQDLDVDYEQLPGQGKEAKARELIVYLEQRGRLADLLAAAGRERPHVAWESLGSAPEKAGRAISEREASPWDRAPSPALGPVSDRARPRVVIRGNTLIGKANRITVAQPDVSVEENLLAGQEQAIDVPPNATGAQQP